MGSSLEYLPGLGTFAKDDDVLSSNIGVPALDAKNHLARLDILTRVPKLQGVGTVTLGTIAELTESSALIDLEPTKADGFDLVPNGITAVLRVSDVKNSYVESMKAEFRTGDIVKVRIVNVSKHTVALSTDGKSLGVVKAACARCRSTLDLSDENLKCSACGSVETRKLSADYGIY